jgi:phosphatidylserine decarboxylase
MRKLKKAMVRDGIYYALGSYAAGVLVAAIGPQILGLPFFVFGTFCLWFFRDPDRPVPDGPVAVSPADGKVMSVVQETPEWTRVSIFLNVFDVHVNRTPIAGVIREIKYQQGEFLVASKELASAANEQNTVIVEGEGTRVMFKQIAGLIARRIEFWKNVGDQINKGERIGLMKFGSRMDVLFGPEWEILVKPRDRVRAASSPIARIRQAQPTAPQA